MHGTAQGLGRRHKPAGESQETTVDPEGVLSWLYRELVTQITGDASGPASAAVGESPQSQPRDRAISRIAFQ